MSGSRRINLSEESTVYLNQLHDRLQAKCEKSAIYKMAFARGLMSSSEKFLNDYKSDSKGSEIRIDSIENLIFDALVRQKFNLTQLENKGRYYKLLIDFGANLLKQEDDGDENKLILNIYNRSKIVKRPSLENGLQPVLSDGIINETILTLGEKADTLPVTIKWNDKSQTGQHLVITGKTGAGKTHLALEIISQMVESNKELKVIFFDYAKGDVAANEKFAQIINADVIDVANEGLPFNPFYLEEVNDQKIEELKEIFTSIQNRLGPKQSLELFDLLSEAYNTYSEPDLNKIYQLMLDTYDQQGKNKDVLVELFHKLDVPKIFPASNKSNLFRTISDKSIIYDIHNIDSHMKVKELITFLILNKIYTETIRMPDSRVDNKTELREMRTLIVIDEAHNYLDAKNRILERMLRELRSKGVAVMLLTQGFDDLIQKNFDFSSMMNWILLMKSDNSRQNIEKALAVPKEIASRVTLELSTTDTGLIYTRKMFDDDKHFTKFQGKAFWQRV